MSKLKRNKIRRMVLRVAEGTASDSQYVSMSANAGSGAEALLPVQLDPKAKSTTDYSNIFYPARSPGKSSKTTRRDWADLGRYLVEMSAYLNTTLGTSRYLLGQAEIFATMDENRRSFYSKTFTEDCLSNVFAMDANNPKEVAAASDKIAQQQRAFVEGIGSGTKHVIRPSLKFKGGYDIIYSGLPGTPASFPVVGSKGSNTIHELEYAAAPLRAPGSKLALPQGVAAVDMARTLLQGIFIDEPEIASVRSAPRRVITQLPLGFNFKAVLKEATSKVTAVDPALGLGMITEKCPSIPSNLVDSLGEYFSIIAIREAPMTIVRKMQTAPGTDLEATFALEPYLTNATVGLSIVLHLPPEIVNFITQTRPGDRVPLVALNTWASIWSRAAIRIPRQKMKKGDPGGEPQSRVNLKNCPRYVLSASSTAELAGRRKKLGMYTEDGRTNSDDLFVSNVGTLNYCPKAGDLSLDNAKNYEGILEEALKLSFDAGSPLMATGVGETSAVFSLASPSYRENIAKLKSELLRYKGSLQAFSWDYNTILTTALSDPEKLNNLSLAGAARPDELGLSDYLKKPFCEAMPLLFVESKSIGENAKKVTQETFGKGGSCAAMLKTSLFAHTFQLYAYLSAEQGNIVPSLQELVAEAAKDLGITTLTAPEDVAALERNLYSGFISPDLKVSATFEGRKDPVKQSEAVITMLSNVLRDAAGGPNSNLAKLAYSKGSIPGEEEAYFDAENHTLAEFKNVYHYLGGRIAYHMFRHMLSVDKKKLLVLNLNNPVPFVNFTSVVREVMPLATILGKYTVESEAIYAKAEELARGNERDTSIGPDDIHVPGSRPKSKDHPGYQLFPHQVEGQQYLRNKPRFAVLDVAPGGGKTIAVITDVGSLISEKAIRRPLVMCPNGLVKNWVEDLHKVTQGKWNAIPITTQSFNTWGEERLTKMIANAPPNTLVVVGFKTLQIQRYPVVIGNHVEQVSGALEFVKKFGFDYVAIDESHRIKNPKSSTHKTVKQLCTASCVKFIRLATGTLISDRLTDIVGQSAMFNAQIFRTPEEYAAANMHMNDNDKLVWNDGTAAAARKHLSRHAAVISSKRKEWAFMLPVPIEEFISVGMTKRTSYAQEDGDVDGPVDESQGGDAQQILYNTVLTEVMEEMEKDADLKKLIAGHGEDEGDDDDDDSDKELDVDGTGGDLDDATLNEISQKLQPYLARLEMMLTDPLHSDVGQIYFKSRGLQNFVSNKVLKVIERIRLNFEPIPWIKGKEYELKDICDIGDKRWVLMPPKDAKFGSAEYRANYVSKINPADDPRWKPEPRGKVIVFCRYKSTVNCIFEHLPADLKKMAVKFHGDIKERWGYLTAFKEQPIGRSGVQILIANEQSISEGHNLQMANRLIRVEAPWAPGELDQAQSRIFRPDPSGKFSRENVYLDWILTNNSLEVAKMGRLISKMVIKSQFDEAQNPLYQALQNFQLPLISMSLKTLSDTPTLQSIEEYTDAYGQLISIQSTEFAEMRATKPAHMFDIPESPIEDLEGQSIIQYTPYVPSQDVPDRHNFGLFKLVSWLEDTESTEVQEVLHNPKRLIGKYAHTEMGNGTIINVTMGRPDADGVRSISRVQVKIEGVEDTYSGDASMIYLATNLTSATIKEFALKTPWATKGDKARAERLEARAERRTEREELKAAKQAAKDKAALEKLKLIEKMKKAVKKGKPVPEPEPEPELEEEEENNNIELFPVVYNGFLAIEAITEDPTIELKPFGFRAFGEYAYVPIKTIKDFEAVLTFLQKRYTLPPKTIMAPLEGLRGAFAKKFASESVTNLSELKNFYRLSHQKAKENEKTGKMELKVYPVILNNVLMLNIDLGTNPTFRKYLGKPILGSATAKFQETSGIDIQFLKSKPEMIQKAKELKAEGFVITNYKEFLADVKTINPKMQNI